MAVEREGEGVKVSKAKTASDLRGSLPPSDLDSLKILMEERRLDRIREDRHS